MWLDFQKLVCDDEAELTEDEKQYRMNLGEKAVKAIKRLSAVPMPDLQSAFLGSRA
jgi:hypothetical protein